MAIIGLQKGSGKSLRVREKSVKSQGILIWILSGNPVNSLILKPSRTDNLSHVPSSGLTHYDNTPMQYIAIFHGCKNDNFQVKDCDIFLIFSQNIDCGYTYEPPQSML